MNNILSWRRITLVGKKDFYTTQRQFILISSTIITLIVLIGLIIGNRAPVQNSLYEQYFLMVLYLGGLISTAAVFKDRHSRDSIHNWLMLPASTLEKFLIRFLYSTLGMIILSFAAVWISSLLTGIVNWFLYKQTITLFNPFPTKRLWWELQIYLTIHPFFFLGATWFRKNHFIKTVLVLILFQFFMGIVLGLLGFMTLIRYAFEISDMGAFINNATLLKGGYFPVVIRILFQGIIPLCCWTAAYFRLKEAEIKDGV